MLTHVIREAFRQVRRRPLAIVLALAVQGLALLLDVLLAGRSETFQLLGMVVILVVTFLVTLFMIPYLADGLVEERTPGLRQAWAKTTWAIRPALRVVLLMAAYIMLAVMVANLFAGGDPEADPTAQLPRLMLGAMPLIAFAVAFLVVALQRVMLDGEEKALLAAAFSHRVAREHFPVCLLIGLLIGLPSSAQVLVIDRGLGTGAAIAISAAAGLLRVWVPAMSNALYLRTRATVTLERRS